jgi:hypothetical protein
VYIEVGGPLGSRLSLRVDCETGKISSASSIFSARNPTLPKLRGGYGALGRAPAPHPASQKKILGVKRDKCHLYHSSSQRLSAANWGIMHYSGGHQRQVLPLERPQRKRSTPQFRRPQIPSNLIKHPHAILIPQFSPLLPVLTCSRALTLPTLRVWEPA